jgi:hypothetical protein
LTIDLLVNLSSQVLHAVDANSLVAEVAPLPLLVLTVDH